MEKKTRQPKQRRAIENKALLLSAAQKLFNEKGFLNTSSNDIAREAGVSIGTFYAYYTDKKEIFMELIDEYTKEYNKILEDALDSIQINDCRRYIKTIIIATIDICRKYDKFQDEMIALRHTDEDIKKQNAKHNEFIILKIKCMFERINSPVEDINLSAFLCFCLVDSFCYSIIRRDDLEINTSIEQCVEMVLRYTRLD